MRGCAAARGVRLSAGQPKPTGLRGLLARLMLWRLTGVRSRMLAWACLACALFLARPAWPSPRCMTEWTRASWPPPARCWPPAWR